MAPKSSPRVSPSPQTGKPKHRSVKKKTIGEATSLATLQKVRTAHVNEYTKVKNTENGYRGYIRRGKAFLAAQIEERKLHGEEICSQGILTSELAKAFDNPPNQYSAKALELFIVQKCFADGLGKSTAEGIHGAFVRYWDVMCVLLIKSQN